MWASSCRSHYHVKDIALKELSLPFITDYETFLRTDKHLKINSAMVFVRNLRAMVFRAIDNEWLVKDPFRRYEYKEEETTREFSEQRRDSSVDGDTYHKKEDEHGA